MKIFLLADCNSPHTIKWAVSLAEKGINVYIYSFNKISTKIYNKYKNITLFSYNNLLFNSIKNKSKYFFTISHIRNIINKIKPDILHAHYASSYGFIAALINYHPLLISMWGSDVLIFPKKNIINKYIIKFAFSRADMLFSTSKFMKVEAEKYTNKDINVIPFGVDLDIFNDNWNNKKKDEEIIIGTIKTLEKIYGIEYLIQAFSILRMKYNYIKLLIVGDGSLRKQLEDLAKKLGIYKDIIFAGKIEFDKIPYFHNEISIFVALSESESFGVSVIEAMACKKPVVVSDIGGFAEIVDNGVNGYIVPAKDPIRAAEAIEKLILNRELREKMGIEGREKVKNKYEWQKNCDSMISFYKGLL